MDHRFIDSIRPRQTLELSDFYEYLSIQPRSQGSRVGGGLAYSDNRSATHDSETQSWSSLEAPMGTFEGFPTDTLISLLENPNKASRFYRVNRPNYYLTIYHLIQKPILFSGQFRALSHLNAGLEYYYQYEGEFDYYLNKNFTDLIYKRQTNYVHLELDQSYSWFLSRRSTLTINHGFSIRKTFGSFIDDYSNDGLYQVKGFVDNVSESISLKLEHYFSPRLSLELSGRVGANYTFESNYESLVTNSNLLGEINWDVF